MENWPLFVGCLLAIVGLEFARIRLPSPPRHQWRSELIATSRGLRVVLYSSAALFVAQSIHHFQLHAHGRGAAMSFVAVGLAALTHFRFDARRALHVGATALFGAAAGAYIVQSFDGSLGYQVTVAPIAIATAGIAWEVRRQILNPEACVRLLTSVEPDADRLRAYQGTWIYGMLIWGVLRGLT